MSENDSAQSQNELIERTKNWGIEKHPDGTTSLHLKLDFSGSVYNAVRGIEHLKEIVSKLDPDLDERDIWVDTWGITEAARLYNEGREAWLRGDFETVADLFGVLV